MKNKKIRNYGMVLTLALVVVLLVIVGKKSKASEEINGTEQFVNNEISIMSQNLRVNKPDKDGIENMVSNRYARLFKQLEKYDTDIKCFQEYSKDWKNLLPYTLTDSEYYFISEDNNKGLGNPIFIKKSRFELLNSGTYELSKDSSNTNSENRLANWAKVKDKSSNKIFVICNAHLGFGTERQYNSCKNLMAQDFLHVDDVEGFVICGDFNLSMDSNNKAYSAMLNNGETKDLAIAAATEGEQGETGITFHNYYKPDTNFGRIDFFFGSQSLTTNIYSVIKETYNGGYVSDHYGIITKVSI